MIARAGKCVVLAFATITGTATCSSVGRGTRDDRPSSEILWDTYGVPHIRAADRRSLAFAFGWAQMRNHSDLLLRLAAQARGRAAEYLGPGYLDEDR